jgi:glycerophosphoryl diester phosphodiesterase
LGYDVPNYAMAFSPDGEMLVVGWDSGIDRMYIYNTVPEPVLEYGAEIAGIIASFEDANDCKVLIAAHRGDHKNYPENSIFGMLSAVDIGAQIVEMDVRKTEDDVFILMCDATIDRTTNGSGTVSELTLAEIQEYYLYYPDDSLSNFKVPTLQDTMIALKGRCLMMLDKSNDYFDECADLARSCGVANQVIIKSSEDDPNMLTFLNYNSDIYYGAGTISQGGYESKLETLDGLDGYLEMISISYEYESSWLISSSAQALSDQYDVRVWNNSLDSVPQCSAGHTDEDALIDPNANWGWQIDHGIDIIQTNEPEALKNYLCSIGKHYCYAEPTYDGDHVFGLWKIFETTNAIQAGVSNTYGLAFDPNSLTGGIYGRVYLANHSTADTRQGVYAIDIINETTGTRLLASQDMQTDVAVASDGTVYAGSNYTPYVYKVENPTSGSPTETQLMGNYGGIGDDNIGNISLVPSGFGGGYEVDSDIVLFDSNLDANDIAVVSVLDQSTGEVTTLWTDNTAASIRGETSSYDGYAYWADYDLPAGGANNNPYIYRINGNGVLERIFLDIDADAIGGLDSAVAVNPADGSFWMAIDDGGTRNVYRVDAANAVLLSGTDYIADITLEIGNLGYDVPHHAIAFSPDGKLLVIGWDSGVDRLYIYHTVDPDA